MENKLEIYRSEQGIEVSIILNNDTLWATQKQMAEIFNTSPQNITIHLKKVFSEREIDFEATCKERLQVQFEGSRAIKRKQLVYNLDAILSVGYRINSIQGTHFRQWATQRLKDYLIKGVAINEKRLEEKEKEIQVLHDGIRILSRAIEEKASGVEDFSWLHQFSIGLQLLDDYDHEALDANGMHTDDIQYPSIINYLKLVQQMRIDFKTVLFGKKKDEGFESAVNQIKQGIGNADIYPSIEEKAAMLLYLVVKNHAFVDGNKRIAAACFLLFLEYNGLLYASNGQTIISSEALASLTLFVAGSKADEMETVKKLLISVLNRSFK